MTVERIQPPGLRKSPVYAHVVKAGNTIYIAGQVAQDEQGQVVGRGDITAQATQVFENLSKALTAAGASFSDLVKITIYITDPRFREPLGKVRTQYIRDALPASTLVVVAGLAEPDYLIEIEAVAVVG
jgi:enamine deaminase RidA (YjgF/YER057c/UK114 family)